MDLGQSRFDMGQRVWLTHTVSHSEHATCGKCGGDYRQVVKWPSGDQEVLCGHCDRGKERYKTLRTTKTERLWLSGIVCSLSLEMPARWADNWNAPRKARRLHYSLKDVEVLDSTESKPSHEWGSYIFDEEKCFPSLPEAEAFVEQRIVEVLEAT